MDNLIANHGCYTDRVYKIKIFIKDLNHVLLIHFSIMQCAQHQLDLQKIKLFLRNNLDSTTMWSFADTWKIAYKYFTIFENLGMKKNLKNAI